MSEGVVTASDVGAIKFIVRLAEALSYAMSRIDDLEYRLGQR
jgi:hypothetical protein